MFSHKQIKQIKDHGLTVEEVESQIEKFKKGVAFAKIDKPATLGDGIVNLDDRTDELIKRADEVIKGGKVQKFVPASGAASRMFKVLNAALEDKSSREKNASELKMFESQLDKFPFYKELMEKFEDQGGLSLDDLLEKLLTDKGLNYAQLPKGLLPFHVYGDEVRTAFEEHLVEGEAYLRSKEGRAKLHFTVSPEHRQMFEDLFVSLEEKYGMVFKITYSVQKPETDTIAVDLNNKPFIDNKGSLVFRPGGHGALINNLNDICSGFVFIKNIDNVAPDHLKDIGIKHKKIMFGYLVMLQEKIFKYLNDLDKGGLDLAEVLKFAKNDLNIKDITEKNIKQKLNRPIRICAMVQNLGEPGGGPYWVGDSLQIVEKDEISPEDKEKYFPEATHFNPVDKVCALYDYQGKKFDLLKYINEDAYFIAEKSKDGRPLKALERPGLWNGAMANWSTIFVEVPVETFTPVKTVFDFLRDEHQPK